jgi:uncharacterized protein (DUF433 family)
MRLATAPSLVVPLATDDDDVTRVGGTRVMLDTVLFAYSQGAPPEEIIEQYDSLKLADVYVVVDYYLQNREEVEAYLRVRDVQHEKVRLMNETRFDPSGIRDRLLARAQGGRL